MSKHIVVIGNGMVGQRFVETLREADPAARITVLGAEPRPAYDRVRLSAFFSGTSADELSMVAPGFYDEQQCVLRMNARVASIDASSKEVHTEQGEVVAYDKLVLATGSYPFVPPVEGSDRDNCFVYRTIEDLEAMQAAGAEARVGVVVGGGLLGLEAAKALADMGLETHVVEFAPRLMAVQLDDAGGALLRRKIEALGVHVHTGCNTKLIEDGVECRHRMCFADGETLETDMIVFSAGIRPCDALAREAGLALGERGGVAVDDACRSSEPDIYAIGECAAWNGRIFGLVAPGYEMAKVAAGQIVAALSPENGAGDAASPVAAPLFQGADMSTKLKLLGVEVASIGNPHAEGEGVYSLAFQDERTGVYKKLLLGEADKALVGAVMVGDSEDYATWLQMAQGAMALPEDPQTLLLASSDGASAASDAMPDSAQICSCNDVSKGALCGAVREGCTTIAALKSETKAGTSCGGCVPLVTKIMNAELEAQGVTVNNHLCVHFPYSRQELYHLVRVNGYRSFQQLLDAHGRGHGCDICKPAVASILASCWNDFVLAPEHAGMQDSNDYFLGNIQRDGTYSIVPRVPGGEITPDKLVVLGQVAQRYGLYTKITGGQRIDLFGAQVHQLPHIWDELIAAGFESGHAYGKAMRTVKSCVGSTWCRYGVQDSVGMAIELEHRYKGLRAPHKIKLGVSGCTRECAEAQSKDVGVIATERGWNLYVCGNGGMKPRHAELLASDLDRETLLRYIDRFLMFYIRTAERLQRTAGWRDNLEGGLDYLKAVVIEDSLGIGAELEAEMAQVIATYACEWQEAVNNPEARKRFRTFVNADGGDEQIVTVEERGQRRPATDAERATLRGIPVVQETPVTEEAE
ncbi:nitrite reductase large subunit NirB [Algiphilus aromaticivorans]|uniref:nitrite reductase large subunit NirB n=1 Tax=Algiphilus aromaticivorans TaxID=382454 RepID=UPI0005C1B2D8|nr:nitrite reductase large subunit NirB [Algiphilus aromaticivorans]